MLLNTIFGVKKISSNGKKAKYEVIDISHKRQNFILLYLVLVLPEIALRHCNVNSTFRLCWKAIAPYCAYRSCEAFVSTWPAVTISHTIK